MMLDVSYPPIQPTHPTHPTLLTFICVTFLIGRVPARQPGFDFAPFDFAATRRGVDTAMANFALQVRFCSLRYRFGFVSFLFIFVF